MGYVDDVLGMVKTRYKGEGEFIQAVTEVFESLKSVIGKDEARYKREAILERLVMPDRQIAFRVNWVDDAGNMQVNNGYRVQFNNALGPYKGGIRFRENVNLSIIKFLGFEQTFKNALTALPLGGGKGGSDFDPKGKSDREIMAFCQAFMTELTRYIGADIDVPAGDIGVGAREIGYMYGQYKRMTSEFTGVFTGKGIAYGGSLARTEATGYGLLYFTDAMLKANGHDLTNKKIAISGSGNVAIYACEKAISFGATVIAMSDSGGYTVDADGIDLALLKDIKENQRGRISDYVVKKSGATYFEKGNIWEVPVDIALPCATQNELTLDDAKLLVSNGCLAVAEGANMPTTIEATHYLQQNGVLFAPGKASNAGGVATSQLEMAQNSMRIKWDFEEVDAKLKAIMENIFELVHHAATDYGAPTDYVLGANIAGFLRVSEAMQMQGV